MILTMGCRERTRGALGIPGERPAGVFTAGVAQAYINPVSYTHLDVYKRQVYNRAIHRLAGSFLDTAGSLLVPEQFPNLE